MRYNRFGFQSNKFNVGDLTPFNPSNISITETTNSTAVTYSITSDITHLSNLAYTMSGDAVATDFSDSAISGNIALSSGNGTLVKEIVLGNGTDPNFTVQLRASASDVVFYTGNTFQVTTLGEPNVSMYISGNIFANNWAVGTGVYNNTNVSIHKIIRGYNPSGFLRFDSVGTTGGNMEVLLVAGGGGAGARYNNPYTENFRSAGGGGGGEHTLLTIPLSTIVVGQDYPYTIGERGAHPVTSPIPSFETTKGGTGGNTSIFGVTVVGGTGGEGNAQPATSNAAGIGGSSSYTAGGNGGNGSRLFDANSDGQDGQVGTVLDQWQQSVGSNSTVANVTIGSGGGSANSEVGAAPSNQTPAYGILGSGGSAIGGAGDVGNTFFRTDGTFPESPGFVRGSGDQGTIQLRWPTQAASRTIAIA